MQKAGIITFLHNMNYGSLLQAYALERVLESLQIAPIHLDYSPDIREKIHNMISSHNSPILFLEGLKKRSARIGHEAYEKKRTALNAFRNEHLSLSGRIPNIASLEKESRKYDLLFCGSDQIWSPVWLNPAYYLDFSAAAPKIAYACSLGVKSMPGPFKASRIRSMIQSFSSISVREKEGADILRFISGKDYPVMPDPVALLSRREWLSLSKPADGEKRLFCYLIGNRPDDNRRIETFCSRLDIQPVVFPASPVSFAFPGVSGDLSTEAFIGSLFGASCILTDSFHGALLACIAGVPFSLIRRYSDSDPSSGNSRIDQLIRDMQLAENNGFYYPGEVQQKLLEIRKSEGISWIREAVRQAAAEAPVGSRN